MNIQIIIGFIIAYLLGSIPSAVWCGKRFHQLDIREHGSGNAGTANTFRILGKQAGVFVLFVDVLKGSMAVLIAKYLENKGFIDHENIVLLQLSFGLVAIIGHLFPVFAQFKGGKGVATFLGMMLVIHWQASLSCVVIFGIVFFAFRYTSLASIISSICLPILLISGFFEKSPKILVIFSVVCAILIIIMHRENIKRLINNEENGMKQQK